MVAIVAGNGLGLFNASSNILGSIGILRQGGRKQSCAQVSGAVVQSSFALTPRQQEIRALLRRGLSNKMIAGTLGVSEGTVKNHVTEILRVLNATNSRRPASQPWIVMNRAQSNPNRRPLPDSPQYLRGYSHFALRSR